MKLGDFVQINPKISLKKGATYPFLGMKDINSHQRSAKSECTKVFSGSGSRFQTGDTLLARITPCLENGKTSQYRGAESPAWGSTEFIVLREITGKTDNLFIYYLSISPKFRAFALLRQLLEKNPSP